MIKDISAKLYWSIKPQHALHYWSTKKMASDYWDVRNHPSKVHIANIIAELSPDSVLEIGCASAPNLYQLAKLLPHAKIDGMDINEEALEYGRRKLSELNMDNITLICENAEHLYNLPPKSYDIVFSSGLLLYIDDISIVPVISNMLSIAKHYLVFMELGINMVDEYDTCSLGVYRDGMWLRNYKKLFGQFVGYENVEILSIPKMVWATLPWSEYGVVVKVSLE